jgi:hypothetical protein
MIKMVFCYSGWLQETRRMLRRSPRSSLLLCRRPIGRARPRSYMRTAAPNQTAGRGRGWHGGRGGAALSISILPEPGRIANRQTQTFSLPRGES